MGIRDIIRCFKDFNKVHLEPGLNFFFCGCRHAPVMLCVIGGGGIN